MLADQALGIINEMKTASWSLLLGLPDPRRATLIELLLLSVGPDFAFSGKISGIIELGVRNKYLNRHRLNSRSSPLLFVFLGDPPGSSMTERSKPIPQASARPRAGTQRSIN
jgi:hypothetical protein